MVESGTPEELEALARYRELGFDADTGTFTYRATDPGSGLVEPEIDHVLVGRSAGEPAPDAAEVQAWDWVDVASLRRDLAANPDRYTPWLGSALELAVP